MEQWNNRCNQNGSIPWTLLPRVLLALFSHYGISGNIVLNDGGDRINADYDIWSVTKSNLNADQYIWKHDTN